MIEAMLAAAAVVFMLVNPTAKSVLYAGDLTSWDHPAKMQKKGDNWTFKASLPPDARVEYKFIVDGAWILDPSAPKVDTGLGVQNSYWQGPKYKFDIPDGDPKFPMLRSETMIEGYKTVLFQPADKSLKNLPILAYADGNTYESMGKVQNVLENLAEQNLIRHVVLVLVTPKDREQDYWKNSKPAEAVFISEILPWVRENSAASSDSTDVFVGGSSLGGVFALRLAEDYPDIIGGGIHSQSGAFWVEPADMDTAVIDRLTKGIRLFLDYGTFERELTKSNQDALKILKQEGVEAKSLTTPEGHNWTAWRHRMVPGLEYLLGQSKGSKESAPPP
jgi:enterochelin esterase-like enzyme